MAEEGLAVVLGGPQAAAPRALTRLPAASAASAWADSLPAKPNHAANQLSRSPGVIARREHRHSPTLAMPESALPTRALQLAVEGDVVEEEFHLQQT